MAEVRLRPKARSDIDAIWDYTVATWDVQQARHYLNGLRDACTELADNPELGKCRDELYKGLRVYPSGKHLVFYLVMDKASMLSASCTEAWMLSAICNDRHCAKGASSLRAAPGIAQASLSTASRSHLLLPPEAFVHLCTSASQRLHVTKGSVPFSGNLSQNLLF